MVEIRYIADGKQFGTKFSICTLVADQERYDRMIRSFSARGFTAENSEFIALDNRTTNNFDGFTGLRRAVQEAKGRYILYTHDDIELETDGYEELCVWLERLDQIDASWAIAGNAGIHRSPGGKTTRRLHLADPHGDFRIENPAEVESLDENFLILNSERLTLGSLDLKGFHLYASDLCMMGRIAGASSYVLPFHLRHHSGGSASNAFEAGRDAFRAKYRKYFVGQRFRAPCAKFDFGWSGLAETGARLLHRYH